MQSQNQHLDYLIDLCFQGMSRIFASFYDRTVYTGYFLPKVEINNYNVMIDGRNFFEEPVKNNIRTYENFRKNVFGQKDHYTVGSLLIFP